MPILLNTFQNKLQKKTVSPSGWGMDVIIFLLIIMFLLSKLENKGG